MEMYMKSSIQNRLVKYPPVNPRFPHFLHGGDYNPDQWAATPEIWDQDMRLMKKANCYAMTVGVFSWAQLEPEEGKFTFGWLDIIMETPHPRTSIAAPRNQISYQYTTWPR